VLHQRVESIQSECPPSDFYECYTTRRPQRLKGANRPCFSVCATGSTHRAGDAFSGLLLHHSRHSLCVIASAVERGNVAIEPRHKNLRHARGLIVPYSHRALQCDCALVGTPACGLASDRRGRASPPCSNPLMCSRLTTPNRLCACTRLMAKIHDVFS
jgi:hypothetical protein